MATKIKHYPLLTREQQIHMLYNGDNSVKAKRAAGRKPLVRDGLRHTCMQPITDPPLQERVNQMLNTFKYPKL